MGGTKCTVFFLPIFDRKFSRASCYFLWISKHRHRHRLPGKVPKNYLYARKFRFVRGYGLVFHQNFAKDKEDCL